MRSIEPAQVRWRTAAGIVGLIELLAVLPTGFFAMMSAMMFDAPGSTDNGLAWALFWSAWALPLACLAGGVLALIAAARFTPRRFGIAIGMPLVNLAFLAMIFLLLDRHCGGNFACGR